MAVSLIGYLSLHIIMCFGNHFSCLFYFVQLLWLLVCNTFPTSFYGKLLLCSCGSKFISQNLNMLIPCKELRHIVDESVLCFDVYCIGGINLLKLSNTIWYRWRFACVLFFILFSSIHFSFKIFYKFRSKYFRISRKSWWNVSLLMVNK